MRSESQNNPAVGASSYDDLPEAAGYREALDLAFRTFQLIREYKTPPIPKAYEVLYSYVCSDRDLVRERVDDAVQRYGALNLYDIE